MNFGFRISDFGFAAAIVGLLAAACLLLLPPAACGQTPAMKTEDQLRIRNLQYEQDKKLLEMKRLEDSFRAAQAAVKETGEQIQEAVRAGAKAAGVDLDRFIFDLDSLTFIARPGVVEDKSEVTKPTEDKKPK